MNKKPWNNQRVTIKDIARVASVDPSTVTRALQGSSRVKSATREQIQSIASELGYVPSAMARSLVNRRSQLIGVVIPDMTNPFFADLAHGIEAKAAEHNLRVLIRNTEGREEDERDAVQLFSELGVDGLIVPMARGSQSFYSNLESSSPVIHVNRDDAQFHVSCDTSAGSEAVMQHFLELGHRRIGFVNGPAGPAREPKFQAYRQALEHAGIPFDDALVYQFDGAISTCESIASDILATAASPTAVFAWNDVCAIGLLHAMHRLNVQVPEAISIAGHDDIEQAEFVFPALTTVRWPMYELGVESVRYLLDVREGQPSKPPTVSSPKLVVRASTGAVPPL